MKKALKVFFSSISVMIPFGFIIGFATAWNAPPSINAAGSSALQPLMTALGNNYSDADIVVQSGGSGEGVKVAAHASKDLGNASKNPYSSVEKSTVDIQGYSSQDWKNNEIKTVTLAWDAIAIVYKPQSSNEPVLNIDKDNIYKLYSAFAGKEVTYSQLGVKGNNQILYPYARTGGANASGTATSFMTQSGFDVIENWSSTDVYKTLNDGSYVTGKVRTTSESNVDSWNMLKTENKPGSIIYLSLGFVNLNKKIIEDAGYRIATYNNVEATTENVSNQSYGWFSPLNTMMSLNHLTESTKNFVWWMLTSNEAENIIRKNGFIPLTNDDKLKMNYDLADYGNDVNNLPSKELNKDKFFSTDVSDYKLDYNIGKKYFGVPKEINTN